MKRILILGAAKNQLPLIQEAVLMNYYIVVCDWTKNNPGIKLAHKHYQVSILDKEACLDIAIKENIDGVVSNYEAAMPVVAYISEKMGLVGNSSIGIENIMSKNGFRKLQKECGLYTPNHIISDNFSNISDIIQTYKFPIIVKPCECSATRGTTKFDNYVSAEIATVFAECCNISRNGRACIEEYVEMPSLEIIDGDVFVYNGRILWNGLFTSIRSSYAPMVPTTQVYPIVLDDKRIQIVKDAVSVIFSNAGVKFGEYNIEMYFDSSDRLFVIEINVRQGGNGIPGTILKHSNINFTKLLVSLSVEDERYYQGVIDGNSDCRYVCRHPIYSPSSGILGGGKNNRASNSIRIFN